MYYVWIGLAGGVLSFAHCLGMCGAFVLHLSGGSRAQSLRRQLCWHTGKAFTYVFLGAVAGFAGARMEAALTRLPPIQNLLAWLAGAIMVAAGLSLLGLRPTRASDASEGFLSSILRPFFAQPSGAGALTLGLATGFLPCPIVFGFLALAAQSRSVLAGMTTMAALAAGTLWALLLLGLTGHELRARFRRWSTVVAGLLLIILGVATAARGTHAFHRLLGCPAKPPTAGAHAMPGASAVPAAHCACGGEHGGQGAAP